MAGPGVPSCWVCFPGSGLRHGVCFHNTGCKITCFLIVFYLWFLSAIPLLWLQLSLSTQPPDFRDAVVMAMLCSWDFRKIVEQKPGSSYYSFFLWCRPCVFSRIREKVCQSAQLWQVGEGIQLHLPPKRCTSICCSSSPPWPPLCSLQESNDCGGSSQAAELIQPVVIKQTSDTVWGGVSVLCRAQHN